MILLPKSIAPICRCVTRNRYTAKCVRLIQGVDHGFRAEATDGRKAIVVQGCAPEDSDIIEKSLACVDFHNAFGAMPYGKVEGLVPVGPLADAFKRCKKDHYVGVHLDEEAAVIVSAGTMARVPYETGRFPDINGVVPRGAPARVVNVNCEMLAEVLDAANSILGGDPAKVCFYDRVDGPFTVTGRTDGMFFDAIVLPLPS